MKLRSCDFCNFFWRPSQFQLLILVCDGCATNISSDQIRDKLPDNLLNRLNYGCRVLLKRKFHKVGKSAYKWISAVYQSNRVASLNRIPESLEHLSKHVLFWAVFILRYLFEHICTVFRSLLSGLLYRLRWVVLRNLDFDEGNQWLLISFFHEDVDKSLLVWFNQALYFWRNKLLNKLQFEESTQNNFLKMCPSFWESKRLPRSWAHPVRDGSNFKSNRP